MSKGTEATMIPVMPPRTNVEIKPIPNSMALTSRSFPPQIVANQLNILIPVGTAMIIVVIIKNIRSQPGVPLVNIWCAHTIKPKKLIARLEYAIAK